MVKVHKGHVTKGDDSDWFVLSFAFLPVRALDSNTALILD